MGEQGTGSDCHITYYIGNIPRYIILAFTYYTDARISFVSNITCNLDITFRLFLDFGAILLTIFAKHHGNFNAIFK